MSLPLVVFFIFWYFDDYNQSFLCYWNAKLVDVSFDLVIEKKT